ncbi:MAG: type V CRISPR-associated protein Cas12a/Cpf1 [Campylobacterales bacterium]|nr:type V CRISPR-associated protein Cas12a/Cpf1 [Campylobacterales bacterium]
MLEGFVNQYQLSKTLRFELKPIGKTLEYIGQKGLIEEDEERAEKYKLVKEIIDKYHKAFIEDSLHDLNLNGLDEYQEQFNTTSRDEKVFKKIQDTLRKQVADTFKKHPAWKTLFKKELIKSDLANWSELDANEKATVKEFEQFTTYFTGFHDNRKNMYSYEDKHTAIAFRVIHENLPIFLTNQKLFKTIKEKYPELINQTQKSLQDHLEGAVVEDMFELRYFNFTLSQTHIDLYNQMIGGIKKDDIKIQGFNEKINLYRQQNGLTKRDLPNLKILHKQILSDRDTLSWLPEKFESMDELVGSIDEFYINSVLEFECCDGKSNLLDKIPELFTQSDLYDFSKIYIRNDRSLTDISQAVFKDIDKSRAYSLIKEALWEVNKPKKSKDIASDEEKFFNKKNSYFSVAQIHEALQSARLQVDIFEYFINDNAKKLLVNIQTTYKAWQQNKTDKEKIKAFLDAVVEWLHLYKPLNAPNDMDKDIAFYSLFDSYYESIKAVIKLYDKVRNFMTKKPYSLEKFKFNFQSGYLLNGWSPDYDTRAGLLFEKDGNYYLGINIKKLTEVEKEYLFDNPNENLSRRIILDFQKPDNKNIPRLFIRSKGSNFAPAVAKYNLPIQSVIEIYDNGKFKTEYRKKNPKDYIDSLHKLIDYFKQGFLQHESYKHYKFGWKETKDYLDIAQFYQNVETSCYEVKSEDVNWNKLINYVNEGKLYLFQIYNKDFSSYSKGTPNMHTLYWRALFDELNLADVVYKLNGQAEIFYRKSKYEDRVIVHKANEPIKNKNPLNDKKESTFKYDITKNRRFLFDKLQLHIPITLNFKAEGNENITPKTLEFIQSNADDIKIIGIDRGERHLLYLSLIDDDGKIIEQYSLNEIMNEHNGTKYATNYHKLLDDKETERANARVNWGVVENIKELKEGYMSHVIHKIATLILEHNAIVVLEDLNFGFKRGRFKVEKQVYQKFEKMLIDKLNYLVDKKREANKLGGVFNALQLTNKFQNFEKMGKQNGFLFYVPAWNTSKIDPVTGFVNLFDTRYTSVEKAKEFFEKFKSIRYNQAKDYFEFEVDNYTAFNPKAEGTRQDWTICTYGERIKTFRNKEKNNQWDSKTVHLTTEFKNLFGNYENDLKSFILAHEEKSFFEQLLYLFRLTLQMRNSVTGTEIDYMISPVADKEGNFYDSRKADESLPKDADANGAYNIARKGLMLVERIKNTNNLKEIDMIITNKDWLQFAQK